jgi:O-methyltransferase involved in polyketide biosynthesis
VTRDFSTISQSARWLLMIKARTTLPFAREAAELVFGADAVAAVEPSPDADVRRHHFEQRARSLDAMLDEVAAERVIELAAGFSFRGLDRAIRGRVSYLDTDLPAVAEPKAELVASLAPAALSGTLRVQALDALDRAAFAAAVDSLPPGPIAVVHEGLLMYLDDAEKAQLATTIRACLRDRGGVWITADVYVRGGALPSRSPVVAQFLIDHDVERRKFADWAAADEFFTGHGFRIERKLAPSTNAQRPRETWMMTAAG